MLINRMYRYHVIDTQSSSDVGKSVNVWENIIIGK